MNWETHTPLLNPLVYLSWGGSSYVSGRPCSSMWNPHTFVICCWPSLPSQHWRAIRGISPPVWSLLIWVYPRPHRWPSTCPPLTLLFFYHTGRKLGSILNRCEATSGLIPDMSSGRKAKLLLCDTSSSVIACFCWPSKGAAYFCDLFLCRAQTDFN